MIDSVCFSNDKKCVVWWLVGFFGVKLKKLKMFIVMLELKLYQWHVYISVRLASL